MNLLEALLAPEDRDFLTALTRDVTEACRYSQAAECLRDATPNQLAFDPVKPGGRKSYPAVWIQDFTMIFAGGFLPWTSGRDHLMLMLETQNGPEGRRLQSGARIPPWAIADHINFDARPVFYPGTYSSGEDQGGGPWGVHPPYNNYFDVIWLAWLLVRRAGGDPALLRETVRGLTVYERLQKAFEGPRVDGQGIVYTTDEERAVGFIFCDTIHMTGHLLMATLLRRRAAGHLRDLTMDLGREAEAGRYAVEFARPVPHLPDRFAHPSDWLRAATGLSGQPDVFGTLYALYTHSLPEGAHAAARAAVIDGLERGQIEQEGAIRHVPIEHSFSTHSAWERTPTENNTYQNGAFWHMPAGWLTAVLDEIDRPRARDYLNRYIRHMRREDFRRGGAGQAPWEWVFQARRSENVPVFGPSATLPYAVLAGLA